MASMTSAIPTAQPDRVVIGGIDTHKDIDVAALLDCAGMVLGTAEFPTTRAGYRQLLGWMGSAGHLGGVGVEGTGSCGAGICRQLSAAGVEVVEVNRPDRSQRRRRGKSDALDAAAAAEAACGGQRLAIPKSPDGQVEALRVLRLTRASAVKAGTKALQLLQQLIVTAPEQLPDQVGELPRMELIGCCAAWRPHSHDAADPSVATHSVEEAGPPLPATGRGDQRLRYLAGRLGHRSGPAADRCHRDRHRHRRPIPAHRR